MDTLTSQNIKQHFLSAIKFLKKTTVDKNGKQANLYQVPWYLLIGAEQAGKTSLLVNSELKFTLSRNIKEHALNSQEHLVCDWWVTKQAIFLDIPSSYFFSTNSAEIDIASQQEFLKLFKRYSYKKQDGAIILVLDVYDLMKKSVEETEEFFSNLSEQLNNIFKIIRQKIPVLVLLNKCDLLVGFNEFFSDLPKEERQQYWGVLANNKQQLEGGFDELTARLNNQVIWRLHREPDTHKKALIKDFPAQVAQLQKLFTYLQPCFFAEKAPARLAGVFLTSAAAAKGNIKNPNEKLHKIRRKAFFIYDFFNSVLINLSNHQENPLTSYRKRAIYSVVGGGISIFILLLIGLLGNFYEQYRGIANARYLLAEYQQQEESYNKSEDFLKNMTLLNSLYQSELALNQKHLIMWPDMGNTQLQKLHFQIQAAYDTEIKQFFIPFISTQLQAVLQDTTTDPKAASLSYSALKTYLMLTQQRDKYDENYVLETFEKIWEQQFPKNKILPESLTQQMRVLLHKRALNIITNATLINQTRNILAQLSPIDLGYAILQGNYANDQQLTLNLNYNQNAAKIITFAEPVTIERLYTKEAYQMVYPNLLKSAANEVVNSSWVLGDANKDTISSETPDMVYQQLSQLYLQNYAQAWEKFLNAIVLVNYSDLTILTNNLPLLTGNNGLLTQVLNLFQANMEPSVLAIDPNLNALNNFINNTDEKQISLANMSAVFDELQIYLSRLTSSDDLQQAIFQATKMHMSNNSKPDPVSAMYALAAAAPDPVKNWVASLSTNVWQLMVLQAQEYIEKAWQVNILPDYNSQISTKYPFSTDAATNVNWRQFSNYFAPDGILDNYFNNYLRPFANLDQLKVKNKDGETFSISLTALKFFQAYYKFQQLYFPKHATDPQIIFNIKPVALESGVNDVTLTIGQQQMTFTADNVSPYQFAWPDTVSDTVNVSFNKAGENSAEINFADSWGWLMLLQEGGLKAGNQPGHWLVTFDKNGNAARFEIITATLDNPFALQNFTALGSPPSQIIEGFVE